MFERYTESARRTLFFARYETSQLGGVAIETEHILLGLLRKSKDLTRTIFSRAQLTYGDVQKEIEARGVGEKVPTSVEIPFSAETKRVLQNAAEEADLLRHASIGTEHLLLGLLHEERSVAALILTRQGLTLERTRESIGSLLKEGVKPSWEVEATRIDPHERIDVIKLQVQQLVRGPDIQAHDLVNRILRDLDELERLLTR
jgi:ATP-dependent Clp protease ATP-binding subunit ClpC